MTLTIRVYKGPTLYTAVISHAYIWLAKRVDLLGPMWYPDYCADDGSFGQSSRAVRAGRLIGPILHGLELLELELDSLAHATDGLSIHIHMDSFNTMVEEYLDALLMHPDARVMVLR